METRRKTPRDVFVPGGLPTITYNPRSNLRLEEQLTAYLEGAHSILSISGPTKSGKTVLVRTILQADYIWVPGAQVNTALEFWQVVGARLKVHTETAEQLQHVEGAAGSTTVGGGHVPLSGSKESTSQVVRGLTSTRETPIAFAAAERLKELLTPIIVDDFHYPTRTVQRAIIRSLKDPIFAGVPVILITTPERATEALRAEPEMVGRVTSLQIPSWEQDELQQIAIDGFSSLGLEVEPELIPDLSAQALGSPYLMQDFCLGVCEQNGLKESTGAATHALSLESREAFFKARANVAARAEFERLSRGKGGSHAGRIKRTLKNGSGSLDLYQAVMLAIATCDPIKPITYEEIRKQLGQILSNVPQKNEIVRVLQEISNVAPSQHADPVLDWDSEYARLYVADPFFAFFLKWGDVPAMG